MALPVTTVLTVARTASKVVRYLIRPALKRNSLMPGGWGVDPWQPSDRLPARLQRGASVTRRAAGLGVLALISVLGASLLALSVILLGIGVASGSDVAGWVLGLALLLGVLAAAWVVRRAGRLLRVDDPAGRATTGAASLGDETALLQILRGGERHLPTPARRAFRRTVIATRDALRAASGDTTLERDAYDARQAAREDLPALLEAYQAAPPTRSSDAEFFRQLALIQSRMQTVSQGRAAQRERQLRAHGRYLDDKYTPDPNTPDLNTPEK